MQRRSNFEHTGYYEQESFDIGPIRHSMLEDMDHLEDQKKMNFHYKKVVGYYSLKDEHTINFDSSQLRYYIPRGNQVVHLDLDDLIGISRRYTNTFMNRHINKILHWIQKYHEKIECFEAGEKWIQPNFVCRRGTIETILKISYNIWDDVIICAAKWKGTIYLCKFDTEMTKIGKNRPRLQPEGSQYWANKFQHYMTAETPNGPPNTNKPVDQNCQFSCVFLSCFGDHQLLYSAEMNAVCSEKTLEEPLPLDELKFIELKTTRIIETEGHYRTFERHHLRNWWCQCLPVGVENVICGFRDQSGIIKEIKTYSLDDLTNIIKGYFNPSTSMEYLNTFLTLIASTAVDDCDKTIYKFEKPCYGDIQITEVSPSSEYAFLPQWYTQNTFSK